MVVSGPAGFEKVLVSRITVDNEFLGSVFAYSYMEKDADRRADRCAPSDLAVQELGLDLGEASEHSVSNPQETD